MEQFKWNYVLEKEEDDGKDADDEDNEDEDDKDDDNDSNHNDKKDNVSSTMSNKKLKYYIITLSGDDNMAKSDIAKSYPHLSHALGGGRRWLQSYEPICS